MNSAFKGCNRHHGDAVWENMDAASNINRNMIHMSHSFLASGIIYDVCTNYVFYIQLLRCRPSKAKNNIVECSIWTNPSYIYLKRKIVGYERTMHLHSSLLSLKKTMRIIDYRSYSPLSTKVPLIMWNRANMHFMNVYFFLSYVTCIMIILATYHNN